MTTLDKIEIGHPIKARDHVLFPIEKTSICHDVDEKSCWCHGSKQLMALVVQSALGTQAFEMGTGPITLGELKNIVPGIEAYLQQHNRMS